MLRVEALEIDDHILEKIESKHGISFAEVDEACLSDGRHVRRGREGLYKVFQPDGCRAICSRSPGQSCRRQLEHSYRPGND